MSLKVTLTIAGLMLVAGGTGYAQGPKLPSGLKLAQGPRLVGQDANGPILFGAEAGFEQTPGVRVAPVPEPAIADPADNFPAVVDPESEPAFRPGVPAGVIAGPVDPGAPGVVVPQVDGIPMPVSDCQCGFFYQRVRYKNKGRIAPCAETMVVSVIDPCSRRYDCETKCVQVKICVPACGCPKVKVSRTGRHTRYDFGKYAVDIYSNRNGTVLVDYDA